MAPVAMLRWYVSVHPLQNCHRATTQRSPEPEIPQPDLVEGVLRLRRITNINKIRLQIIMKHANCLTSRAESIFFFFHNRTPSRREKKGYIYKLINLKGLRRTLKSYLLSLRTFERIRLANKCL